MTHRPSGGAFWPGVSTESIPWQPPLTPLGPGRLGFTDATSNASGGSATCGHKGAAVPSTERATNILDRAILPLILRYSGSKIAFGYHPFGLCRFNAPYRDSLSDNRRRQHQCGSPGQVNIRTPNPVFCPQPREPSGNKFTKALLIASAIPIRASPRHTRRVARLRLRCFPATNSANSR